MMAAVRRRSGAAIAVMLTFLPAPPATSASAESAAMVRGFVRTTDASGTWTLRPCGSPRDLPIRDQTPGESFTVGVAEVQRSLEDRRRGVFVEFQGTVLASHAVATQLWRAIGYVSDCGKAPANIAADVRFWATGNEPAWKIEVRGKHAILTRSAHERLRFDAFPAATNPSGTHYDAQTGSTRLGLDVETVLCLDALSETAYGARVTATLRENEAVQTLRGCAGRY